MTVSILVNGWINIHHSYAIVNCMQLIYLYKNHKDHINLYVKETEYYGTNWVRNSSSIYNSEYTELINGFNKWNGEHIDLIYSISFPYDITSITNIPKCVFYTCEFHTLNTHYFKPDFTNMEDINTHIHTHSELYFTSPSSWSAFGMEKIFDLPASRNRIISHGSDVSVFNPIPEITCDTMRESMGISKDTILLGMFGAMTTNKGIHILLSALYDIVIVKGKTNYKLLLKGSNELYDSQTKLETIFKEFKFPVKLLDHIIFTGSTLSFGTLNELYNIVDIYVSPYLAEGFNLSPLEALTAGRRVVVPITGSTEQYMNDIYNNGGTNFITYVNSSVVSDTTTGNSYNQIEDTDLIAAILSIDIRPKLDPAYMIEYISKNYSWSKAADLLYEYFLYILEDNKKRSLN